MDEQSREERRMARYQDVEVAAYLQLLRDEPEKDIRCVMGENTQRFLIG